jgi:hypothetical protein
MRTKAIIEGLKNSQKIRFVIDGFGMYVRVKDIDSVCTTNHRSALYSALMSLVSEITVNKAVTGLGKTVKVYDGNLQEFSINVQIDLVKE